MKRIVMINTVAGGSHGRLMTDLAEDAARAGFDPLCAFARGNAPASAPSVRIGTRADVLLHGALTRALDLHGRGSRGATKRLIEALRLQPPDQLHLHNLHGYYLDVKALFAYIKSARVRTLLTLHDCWPFTGHCAHFMRVGCARFMDGCHTCPLKGDYPASMLLDRSRANYRWKREAFSGVDGLTIAVPSKWLYEKVGASFLKDYPRLLIPNGVDLRLFTPRFDEAVRAAHGVLPGQRMLLAVASPFDHRKGFPDALAAAERLKGSARLVLVGLSEKQLRSLPGHVTGVARTQTPEALIDLYGAADCLLNPTYEDTYPTVNMEAMACGTPVAAYRGGGCAEQLEAPSGIAVPVGDVSALCEAAMALAARKNALSAGCRAYAERHFDRADALSLYRSYYLDVNGGRALEA